MIADFVYYQPVKIYFGAGKFEKLGEILGEMGVQRCVLVCGKHFAPKAEAMRAQDARICAVFGGVEQNPQLSGAAEAARLAREFGADAIVGIGGGSALDTAKFAAAIAPGEGEAEEYYRQERPFPAKPLTIIAVPTTAGTASEVTSVSVISHKGEKKTINQPVFRPKAAIVDPEMTYSVPPRTTMNTGLDALSHALEGYWNKDHQPLCDLTAIEAVRLVMENLETAYRDGGNKEARGAMALASLLAGLTFAQPRTAGCHACSYPLSEMFHLPHGEACAFTLDSFVRINADERLEYLCRRAGLRDCEELAERIAALKELGGLRTRLSELSETVDMDKLVHDSAAHVLMTFNPVPMDEEKLRAMFEALR